MKRFPSLLLWSSAIIFAAIGVYFLLAPERAASSIGVSMLDATGRTDIRATYGGMVLGVALLFAWTALEPTRIEAGLWSLVFIYGGLALGRAWAIAAGERPGGMMWAFLAIEIAYTAGAVFSLKR